MTMSRLATEPSLTRSASAVQLRAVYGAMKILVEDDRERNANATIVCHACRRERPAPGSVTYAEHLLCNGCATDFEVLRIAGLVANLDGFLHRPTTGATAG